MGGSSKRGLDPPLPLHYERGIDPRQFLDGFPCLKVTVFRAYVLRVAGLRASVSRNRFSERPFRVYFFMFLFYALSANSLPAILGLIKKATRPPFPRMRRTRN